MSREEVKVALALFVVCMVYFLPFPRRPYEESLVGLVVDGIVESEVVVDMVDM